MTTIAFRDGYLAADSCITTSTEAGGSRKFRCEKLYRVRSGNGLEAVVGLAGGAYDGLAFLDWYVSRTEAPPDRLLEGEADFCALVLTKHGLFEYDKWCRPERVLERFYAVGSGAKAALGALHMGASAKASVAVACKIDPYTAEPVVVMSLRTARPRRRADALNQPRLAR
jgi:ATP-dependent protease HslVU (ClpYQ) peptidase subunit